MFVSSVCHLARMTARHIRSVSIQTTTNVKTNVQRHQSTAAAVAVDEKHQQQTDERRRTLSMNTVTLVGTITKDPRIFVTPTDKMTLFTVATKKRSGASEFISVSSASQTLAGHVEQKRFQKGDLVYVLGSLENFKDKEGRYRTTVRAETLRKLEKSPKSGDE